MGSGHHDICMIKGCVLETRRHQTAHMADVTKQVSTHIITNFSESSILDFTGIGRRTSNDKLRLELLSFFHKCVVIDETSLFVAPVLL